MLDFGLCCLFKAEKIAFRTTTAAALSGKTRQEQLARLSEICLANAATLLKSVETVHRFGIGAFRIMSPLFPRMTHPDVGYRLPELSACDDIALLLAATGDFARERGIRLSFHPDQFVVLSSPHPAVVANSIRELCYQAQLAQAIGAEIINIHAGGVYGDKTAALERFCRVFAQLPEAVAGRLTLENDDVSYTVADLLPVCRELRIPLVYDVHHHRCNPDGLSVEEATQLAGETWEKVGRRQYCHLSSPRGGWGAGPDKPHADYIDLADLPHFWLSRGMTVDIEAKAKELAVLRLMEQLGRGEKSI